MIPKNVHVVWLGAEMPPKYKDIFEKNKEVLSDYNITLWDNNNIDDLIKGTPEEGFVKRAVKIKKYAFASDAIKLISLEKFGGWALDADNLILKRFDDFNHHSWVSGFENYRRRLLPITAIWGAISHHKFTKLLLSKYTEENFDSLIKMPNTQWISTLLFENGIINNNAQQRIEKLDVEIYPDYVFCGPFVKNKTYALHLFAKSWK